MAVVVRDATVGDVTAINDLANLNLETTTVVWSDTKRTYELRREWFDSQRACGNPVLVAIGPSETFLGFASYGDFRDSSRLNGYRFVAEHTIHVSPNAHGRGIGSLLLQELEQRASAAGKHCLIGVIDGDNQESIAFHSRHGYTEAGRLPEIGWKLDRWLTMVLLQKILDPGGRREERDQKARFLPKREGE